MLDGSDAVSDWPLLNALLSTAGGATWVSLHHGGGVGMGFSQHAGVVIVADGSEAAAGRLRRVLWNDPASGVMRHADAGYQIARSAPGRTAWICRCWRNRTTRRGSEMFKLQLEPGRLTLAELRRVKAEPVQLTSRRGAWTPSSAR